MNKLILIGLLLVLTTQIKLENNPPKDPLNGKNFTVTSNYLNISELNGIDVSFKNGFVSFKDCNNCRAQYNIGSGNSFAVGLWMSTRIYCQEDNDKYLQTLFRSSGKYELKGDKLTLFNRAS